jgi:nascent polypeptide-associated complex subunit alpha|tara:strand:+ start:6272 stop:6622 length:351 start_codon:yes stop_codon:yes gene_type:complete
MFPGMNLNPKKMQKMMQQLGMSMDEIDASEVIIKKTDGTEIRISNPEVSKMIVQGKEMYQIAGGSEGSAESESVEVSEADVEMVTTQTGATPDAAKTALESSGGDLAKAILDLQEE